MIHSANIILRKCGFVAWVLTLATLVSSCKTTFRTVDERFTTRPTEHRRVQILPIWFEGAGNIDHTLSTNDLKLVCARAGENLSVALQQTLWAKGYEIVGPVNFLSSQEDNPGLNPETRQQLETVRVDFFDKLMRQYTPVSGRPLTIRAKTTLGFFRYMSTASPTALEPNPFHCEITPAIANALNQLGATNSEAVILVDTKAFFESRHGAHKRLAWNYTGAVLIGATEASVFLTFSVLSSRSLDPENWIWVDPFWHSRNSLQYNIALVDVHTHEVLWLNRQSFKQKDPRDANVLAETLATTLDDLPGRLPQP